MTDLKKHPAGPKYLAPSVSKPVIPMSEEGQKVIKYAKSQYGKKVSVRDSDGECWALAEAALEDAKAQTSTDIHGAKIGSTVNYVWGTAIKLGQVVRGTSSSSLLDTHSASI